MYATAAAILKSVAPERIIVPMDPRGDAEDGAEFQGTYIGLYWTEETGWEVGDGESFPTPVNVAGSLELDEDAARNALRLALETPHEDDRS